MTSTRLASLAIGALIASLALSNASARPAPPAVAALEVEAIRQAIQEDRLLDAGRMIDGVGVNAAEDPRLGVLSGELGLARGAFTTALADFRTAESKARSNPQVRGEALQGEGIALISTGRSDAALPLLEQAVALVPDAWRAWNALGSLYDQKKDWARAEAAYAKALQPGAQQALVLNNRGYSRLLQGRLTEAAPDFVAALDRQPDLAAARMNLRLTLALQGDYARAMAGGRPDEEAVLLNNAGFAAGARGDYAKAQQLLQQALKARGAYYARASANLKLFQDLPQSRAQNGLQ